MNKDVDTLEKELTQSKEVIRKLKRESLELKKAIWDMLNHAQMYVLILDSNMIIRLINWSLATDLGFHNEREVIGKCWTEFLPEKNKNQVIAAHMNIAYRKDKNKYYREFTNDIETITKDLITVKWFNVAINSGYNMTFSMGLKVSNVDLDTSISISEDSIRSYYRDIIQKDRTMIQSLKDVVLKEVDKNNVCKLEDQ